MKNTKKSNLFMLICFCLIAFGFVACNDNKSDSNKEIEEIENKQNAPKDNSVSECDKANINITPKALSKQELNDLLGIIKGEGKFYALKGMFDNKESRAYFVYNDGAEEFYYSLTLLDFSDSDRHKLLDTATTKIGFENGLLVIEGVFNDRLQQKEFKFKQDRDSMLNELSLIRNVLNTKKGDEDNTIEYASTITKVFIPPCNNLPKDIYDKLNNNLSMGAMSKNDLSDKIMAEMQQQYEIKKEEWNSNWEIREDIYVYFVDSHILEFMQIDYVYTGGAHGVYTKNMLAYSLDNGEKLSNDINSVFDMSKSDELLYIINEKLKEEPYKSKVFEESLPIDTLPQTIFIDSNFVIFVWQIYDIAPYSSGTIEMPINLNELKEFIKADSPYKYLFDNNVY